MIAVPVRASGWENQVEPVGDRDGVDVFGLSEECIELRGPTSRPPTRDAEAPAEISIVVNSPCPAVFEGRTSAAGVEPTLRFGSLNFNHQTSLPSSQSAVGY
jgi:hypothetical protein